MERKFNTTGLCNPNKHYMVDITGKMNEVKAMIDEGNYFTINRGRQYGKTTILRQLRRFLANDYVVISISFESWGDSSFVDESTFCGQFVREISRAIKRNGGCMNNFDGVKVANFTQLDDFIESFCEGKNVVLMIDEVDKTSNNRVFLQFLGVLRAKFLDREDEIGATFQSVILAGVYDIKNIKLKMIQDGVYSPEQSENNLRNSPWNIAVDFKVDMAFSAVEIQTMLIAYENDAQTDMDIQMIAQEIFDYTQGYPFMVSRICQIIHEEQFSWDISGINKAISSLLSEDNRLFNDMSKNLENNKDLFDLMHDILVGGLKRSFSYDDPVLEMALRYGYISFSSRLQVRVFNKIFETRMLLYFVVKNERASSMKKTNALYHNIATDTHFNMELCLEKFAEFFNKDVFPVKEKQLLEIQYRISFLSYLKPLLNGLGHYHIESQLADERRLDVIVNYGRHEYVVELKRIFTESDRTEGLEQLLGYIENRGTNVGYYLTFDFRKKSVSKSEWLTFGDKKILKISV